MSSHLEAGAGGSPVTVRQKLEYGGLAIAGWVLRKLPYRAVVAVSKWLGTIGYWVDTRGRAVGLQNLDAAFEDTKSPAEKSRILHASYQTFARTMCELFWSPRFHEIADSVIRTEGVSPADRERPAIYVTNHFSNFEWLGQNLVSTLGPGIVIAQRLKNPLLGAYFDRLRSTTGHEIVPQERAIGRMLRHLRSGGYFCAVVDLNLDPHEASVVIDEFSGLKTCVTQIHAALAKHTGAKIVPSECRPQPDGTYRMIYHPPLEFTDDTPPAALAQQCWDVLERGIRDAPECWLWSYKHWRFRPSGPGHERYPAYGNSASRFDAALRRDFPDGEPGMAA